jgi:hypothetical protein
MDIIAFFLIIQAEISLFDVFVCSRRITSLFIISFHRIGKRIYNLSCKTSYVILVSSYAFVHQ